MTDSATCPYCRMDFGQEGPAKIYCTGCGMPHHEDCYQENGGCTVFGCPCAPADDPKLHISHSELNAAGFASSPHSPAQSHFSTAANGQPVPGYGRLPKSRTAYIVLGIFLGAFGAHNFYAGYAGKAVGQLCLTLLSFFYLAVAAWLWAVIEICIVDTDSAGVKFS